MVVVLVKIGSDVCVRVLNDFLAVKLNVSHQFCISCTGFLSRDVSTSNWHALSSHHCPARHLRTWPTTYTWSRLGMS